MVTLIFQNSNAAMELIDLIWLLVAFLIFHVKMFFLKLINSNQNKKINFQKKQSTRIETFHILTLVKAKWLDG